MFLPPVFEETGEVSLSAKIRGRLRLPVVMPLLLPLPPATALLLMVELLLWLSKVEQVSSVSGDELAFDED